MTSSEALKRAAAREALGCLRSGMRLGLGTGSTVAHFLDLLGERLATGELRDVVGVPTSVQTTDRAHAAGIPLGSLPELSPLDLTVDGADEVDPGLDLVKGLGGALLREKLVATASRRLLIIADESKRVERLGSRSPLPVEVAAFAWEIHLPFLQSLGASPTLRTDQEGNPVTTDNGNYILDCAFPVGIADPEELDAHLRGRVGVVEHGLFLGLATEALISAPAGVEVLTRPGDEPGSGR